MHTISLVAEYYRGEPGEPLTAFSMHVYMLACLNWPLTVNFKWAPNISWKLHFHVWSHPQIHFCLLRVWMATPRNWSTCGNFWTQYTMADCKGKLSASQTVWLMVAKHHAWTISLFTAKTAHELSVNLSPCLDSCFHRQTLLFIMCSLCAMNQLCALVSFQEIAQLCIYVHWITIFCIALFDMCWNHISCSKWCRACDGNNGHHQVVWWLSCQLSWYRWRSQCQGSYGWFPHLQ